MALNIGELVGFMDLDASGFESGLGSVFDKLKESKVKGAALAGAAGGAIGLALAGAVAGGMDFEAANDKLAAQLGAPAAWAADLGKVAGDLYAGAYGDSLGTVNDALKRVLQDGVAFEDASNAELEGVTAKVLDLSTAFDQDLGGVTRAVGQMMKTGMAKDADEALDIVTRGFQEGADKSDDFLDTLNEYGTQFRKLGIDGQTATGLLVQGIKAGARDSDIVADAIKEFSIRAVDGSDTTAAAFKGIGLNAKTMAEQIGKGGPTASKALALTLDKLRAVKDPAKQAQLATGLFGTQAEDLGAALYALHPEVAADRMGQVAGAATRMGKTLNDNASTNIESFKRKAQQAFVNILGNKALPVVNDVSAKLANDFGPAVVTVTGAVKDAAHWFAEHETTSKILLGTLVGLVAVTQLHAAVLAVQGAGGLMAYLKATKLVTTATKVWTAVQWAMNAAMSANPIGIVIVAIAALVGGLIYAYKHSETFRRIVDGAFHAVGAAGKWLWENALRPAFKLIADYWFTVVGVLVHGAAKAFGWVPGIGPKLKGAAEEFDKLRRRVDSSLSGIGDEAERYGTDWARGLARGIRKNQDVPVAVAQGTANKIAAATRRAWDSHSPSRVAASIGRDWNAGLAQGQHQSRSSVIAAANRTALDLRDSAIKAQGRLNDLLAARRDYVSSLRGRLAEAASIVSVQADEDGALTTQSLLQQLRAKAAQVARFSSQLITLRKLGLSKDQLDKIAGDQNGEQVASALLAGGRSAVLEANRLNAAVQRSAARGATAVGNAMYASGLDSARGIVAGLKARRRDLLEVAADMGSEVLRAVKRGLAGKEAVGHNAAGTSSWRGGLTWVGENGPELINLQQGAAVYSNAKSMQMADRYGSAMGGRPVQIDVHPAPGMDETAIATATGRRFSMLAV